MKTYLKEGAVGALEFGRRLTFELIKLEGHEAIPLQDIEANATYHSFLDIRKENLVLSIQTYVLGMEGETINLMWPRDWWEAVKDRFAPRWFLARWPVDFVQIRERRFGKVFLSIFPDRTTKIRTDRPTFEIQTMP